MIHGFDFVFKFSLTLLSKYERFLKNTIKSETKNLGVGNSVDALIVVGNSARLKLFLKLEKIPIEKMIRKAISKPTYKALRRIDFIKQAENLEKNHLERLSRLRQSKMILRNKEAPFTSLEASDLFYAMDSLNKDFILREEFLKIVTQKLR